jgi:hypothetical protein
VAAALLVRSLSWPLVHDAPLMHYIAWLVGQGAVPYRDVLDMNMPGVYLVHRAVLAVGGAGDAAWRAFDLLCLAAAGGLLYALVRPLGDRWTAASAGMLFALYHLAGGAWRAGQRDFIACALLLAGAWGVARFRDAGQGWTLLAAGLALGAATMLKPHAALYALACAAVTAVVAGRAARAGAAGGGGAWAVAAPLGALAAGVAIPVAAVLGWLAARGGLAAFADVLGGYVLPLYSQVARVPAWTVMTSPPLGWAALTFAATALTLGLVAAAPGPLGARHALLALGAVYGAVHFVAQGKGWAYHLYPAGCFLCGLVGAALGGWRGAPARWGRVATAALFAAMVVLLGLEGARPADAAWIPRKIERVRAVERELAALAPPPARVQVLDVTEGGIHALLRLGLRQPTRFIYDFHFYHHESDPRIQALRAELVRGLAEGRPAAVVVFRDEWMRTGYDRLRRFPELAALLARDYELRLDDERGFRIHAQRRHP